jgi:hypothetical protein
MKYKKQIDKMLHDMLHEDWMSETEYKEVVNKLFELSNTSYEDLDEKLQIGVDNGFDVDRQMKIIKEMWQKKLK